MQVRVIVRIPVSEGLEGDDAGELDHEHSVEGEGEREDGGEPHLPSLLPGSPPLLLEPTRWGTGYETPMHLCLHPHVCHCCTSSSSKSLQPCWD